MKAAAFYKPGYITVDNVSDPKILDPRDMILKVTSTAICGSDLHILSGAPAVQNVRQRHNDQAMSGAGIKLYT